MKEVQQLTGCVSALEHFMSKFVDKCQPFFRVLKRCASFEWNEEANATFQLLKKYLFRLPKIANPA